MSESIPVTVYVPEGTRDRWQDEAEKMEMSQSEFIAAMTEAGQKKFDTTVEPDETDDEIREARNYFQRELENVRREKEKLEEHLHGGERQAITNFIESNPGVSYQDIVTHVADTAPSRVSNHLEEMNGQSIWSGGDGYYTFNNDGEEA